MQFFHRSQLYASIIILFMLIVLLVPMNSTVPAQTSVETIASEDFFNTAPFMQLDENGYPAFLYTEYNYSDSQTHTHLIRCNDINSAGGDETHRDFGTVYATSLIIDTIGNGCGYFVFCDHAAPGNKMASRIKSG